jgi:protein TonB
MDEKKNPNADLRRKTGLHLNVGLVISLALVIMAFEWKFYGDGPLVELGTVPDDFDELMEIPPTVQIPPPPKVQQPSIIAVPDEIDIDEEIPFTLDIESDEEMVLEDYELEEPKEEVADVVFRIVEEQPSPVGGYSAFYEYIGKKLKYPAQARRMGIEGKVFIEFIVDKDGSITEVTVMKGIGGGCDEEALRVIKAAPKWKPGKQRGQPVKVKMVVPITFKLG